MTSERTIPLREARALAAHIMRALKPLSVRIRVAGSIRRRCPVVHDIDIVCLPRDRAAISARCEARSERIFDGPQNYRFRTPSGIEVDIFFARAAEKHLFGVQPSNWGSLLLCRTGSKEHNMRFALAAKAQGLHWNPYEGISSPDGKLIAAEDERELYSTLSIPWKPPEARS